jgi:Electron transfer DM13
MKRRVGRLLGIFVAGMLAAGLVAPSFAGMMMPGKTGMLSGFPGHNASGKASISKDGMGKAILELTGIKVDKVPDGRVYLAKGGDYKKGIELGKLEQFTGDVRFPIPENTMLDDYDSVVIWCKKFDVGIGKATLGMSGMK